MTFKKIFSPRAVATIGILLTATTAMPALAQYQYNKKTAQESPRTTPSAAHLAEQMSRMVERANREIDQRVTRLNALADRIQGIKKITDANKTNLINTIKGEVTTLTNLKAKIAADTDTEIARTDMQSITKAYRIYALVMPQIAIQVAADRVSLISDALTTISQKLTARITAAQTAGNDVSALQSTLANMNTKIANAKTQAQNATQEIATLVPDNGDQAKFDTNKKALNTSHQNIKTAMKDLEAARKDAQDITKGLKAFPKQTPSATPSPSASTSPSPTPTQ